MGYQIVEPSAGSTDWTDYLTITNYAMRGYMGLSLTNYDTTDVPLIAPGSKIEVAGSIFYFSTSETITGSLSTEQNYIMVTTSSSKITASYTTDAPTWVPSKNGWYDSSTGVQRYIGGSATDFGDKWTYGYINAKGGQERIAEQGDNKNVLTPKIIEIGVWDMPSTDAKSVVHGISNWAGIRSISAIIRQDGLAQYYTFTGLDAPSSEKVTNFIFWNNTNIVLNRNEDGLFDSALYDSTSINRGWITVWYEV